MAAAAATRRISGTEVPIPGSDKLRWIDLTVPSSPSPSPASPPRSLRLRAPARRVGVPHHIPRRLTVLPRLEKYKDLHPRLPVIVAETLLYIDPEIELPLWLVQMFKTTKAGNRIISWGMSGKEADPAALFRLYINYGRHAEATNLLVEYLESFASSRPVDVLHRKKMSAAWFPYTAIERLWCQLEEMQSAGHSVDQCDRLKKLLHGAMMSHLQQVVVDSEDVLSSVGVGQGTESQSS